jgi:hypothetical protein
MPGKRRGGNHTLRGVPVLPGHRRFGDSASDIECDERQVVSELTSDTLAGQRKRHRILLPVIAIGLVVIVAIWFALNQYLDARWYAIHSYVASVCQAVDQFQKANGHFPQSLSEIDKSMLDYDLNIPLQELDYELTETGYRVSYQPTFGRVVSCP